MTEAKYLKKDPLYGLAILQVSIELKGLKLDAFSGIVEESAKELAISRKQLEDYIEKNRERLESDCRKSGLV